MFQVFRRNVSLCCPLGLIEVPFNKLSTCKDRLFDLCDLPVVDWYKIALWNKAVGNINKIKNDRIPILSAEYYDSAEIWNKIESRLVLGPKSCFDKI